MPRKSNTAAPKVSEAVANMHYSDWPECLSRYDWIVKEAAKYSDPERMFNVNRSTLHRKWDGLCKVCGCGRMRREYQAHMEEHLADMQLSPAELKKKYPKVAMKPEILFTVEDVSSRISTIELIDVEMTVRDAIAEREIDWFTDTNKLSSELASVIVGSTSEYDGADPVYCADCA